MNLQAKYIQTELSIDRIYTAFTFGYDSQYFFPGETHDFWELDCVLAGNLGLTSGTKLYECAVGELVIHPPGIFHTGWNADIQTTRILTITFNGDGDELFVPHGKFILTDTEKMIISILEKEITEVFDNDFCASEPKEKESNQIFKGLVETLLLSLSRRSNFANVAKSKNAALFSEIAGYMKDNVCSALTLDQISADCHIGKNALEELFKRYTSIGAIKYYNYLRIRHAVKLMHSGKNMEQISSEMNFSSQNYFSTFFKRETGLSPLDYKRQKIN